MISTKEIIRELTPVYPAFRYWKSQQLGISLYLQQILLKIIQIPGHYFVPHLRCSYPFHEGIPTLRSGLYTAASSRLFSLRFQLRLTSRPASLITSRLFGPDTYEARRAGSEIAPAVRPGFGARKQMSAEGAAHLRIQSNIGSWDKFPSTLLSTAMPKPMGNDGHKTVLLGGTLSPAILVSAYDARKKKEAYINYHERRT